MDYKNNKYKLHRWDVSVRFLGDFWLNLFVGIIQNNTEAAPAGSIKAVISDSFCVCRFRQQLSSQSQSSESKYRKQLEELRTANEKLKKDNQQVLV